MATQRLITPKQIVNRFIANQNFDTSYILDDTINMCQLRYVKKLLGKDLYNTIVSQNDTNTLTAQNKELLTEYIQPLLGHWVLYETVPSMRSEPTAMGMITNNPNYGEPATDKNVAALQEKFKSTAGFWQAELIDYACENNIQIQGERTVSTMPILYDTRYNKRGFYGRK